MRAWCKEEAAPKSRLPLPQLTKPHPANSAPRPRRQWGTHPQPRAHPGRPPRRARRDAGAPAWSRLSASSTNRSTIRIAERCKPAASRRSEGSCRDPLAANHQAGFGVSRAGKRSWRSAVPTIAEGRKPAQCRRSGGNLFVSFVSFCFSVWPPQFARGGSLCVRPSDRFISWNLMKISSSGISSSVR